MNSLIVGVVLATTQAAIIVGYQTKLSKLENELNNEIIKNKDDKRILKLKLHECKKSNSKQYEMLLKAEKEINDKTKLYNELHDKVEQLASYNLRDIKDAMGYTKFVSVVSEILEEHHDKCCNKSIE